LKQRDSLSNGYTNTILPWMRSVDDYVRSSEYDEDLIATIRIWSEPGLLETAGTFVLLTYFAMPDLLAVESDDVYGGVRAVTDGHRERTFLKIILGLADKPSGPSGLRDPKAKESLIRLRDHHYALPRMTKDYMTLIGGLLAIAPLRVHGVCANQHIGDDAPRYWRYIANAMRVLDVGLGSIDAVTAWCESFVHAGSGRCELGDKLIRYYCGRHPGHVETALPAMFPAARALVQDVQGRFRG
jgi:hypothetical protein